MANNNKNNQSLLPISQTLVPETNAICHLPPSNSPKNLSFKPKTSHFGFTIVELLVVIVVIAILAVIAFISYSGIASRATAAALQSDLVQASKQIKLYQVDHGFYPSSLETGTNCLRDSLSNVDTRYCLKTSSSEITFSGYTVDNNPSNPTFSLTATKNGYATAYVVTSSTAPTSTTAVTAIGAITGTTTAIGSVLSAGSLTPAGAAATATYQWQRTTTVGGSTYTNIPGTTASTYTLTLSDVGKYIKVVATGTGSYGGSQTSGATVGITDANWLGIGTQVWAKYNSNVGNRMAGTNNQTNNSFLEKYCYGDIEANCTTYGGLYQWGEAMQYVTTEGSQGICPTDSHIPTDNEWKILEMQLGMTQVEADKTDAWRGTDQGAQLKSGGASGLNMPFAGFRYNDAVFYYLSTGMFLWSSTESGVNAWARNLDSGHSAIYSGATAKANGITIRCMAN